MSKNLLHLGIQKKGTCGSSVYINAPTCRHRKCGVGRSYINGIEFGGLGCLLHICTSKSTSKTIKNKLN